MAKVMHPESPLVAKLEGLHLFHFDGAPCAQRVRFALAEKGLKRGPDVKFTADDTPSIISPEGQWASRVVSLIKKDHLSEAYSQIQPNLVVPALVHDGTLYTESMDIIEYLDSTFGGEPLVPKEGALLEQARDLTSRGKDLHRAIRFVTFRWGLKGLGKLSDAEEKQLIALVSKGDDDESLAGFYKSFNSNTIEQDVYFDYLKSLVKGFDDLEVRLGDGRMFLAGNALTIADVIWAMKVLRLDECGYPFKERHPAVFEWYRRIYIRPSFQAGVMAKHRAMNRMFRVKSRLENLFGIGLKSSVMAV